MITPGGKSSGIRDNQMSNHFKFGAVFTPETSQVEVFKEVQELVRSALDGFKVCIFSYGQTGSGKTYTMEGNIDSEKDKGMIPRAVDEIFKSMKEYKDKGWNF